MAARDDDQIPEPTGRGRCSECGGPLAADQRYCLTCGARRGGLPGAVAGTLGAVASQGRRLVGGAGAKAARPKPGDEDAGSSWMPSPQAIAIAVIGMLALGVGLGSAMSEIASSAPLSTILLEYPHHASEAPPAEEPEEEEAEEAPVVAAAQEETAPVEEVGTIPLPEETAALPVEVEAPEAEEPEAAPFNPFEEPEEAELEGKLPEVEHAWLIVLGENSYDSLFSAAASAPYLTRTLPKKGELIPNYYGVTSGVLANEIALLSGQGPTPETSANCPDYTAVAPATVSVFAEQVEGNGCVYAKEVESLPTQLEEKELEWRAYVEDMENGGSIGQPWRCRKPTLGAPDSTVASPGDQYLNWRNPVVYFGAVAESPECEKHDVGFEVLTRDLKTAKKTPALSLIFPDACHAGGEVECEPGAPTGAHAVVSLLKTLVPAIMASPAYAEGGGLIAITSAQAAQAGEHADPSACCLAPEYPNLPTAATPGAATAPGTSTTESSSAATEGASSTTTTYTEESVLTAGGGGKVGLLMISPFVEPGTVAEAEYANHFTLLKTLETMFGLEPLGYATEEEMPTLSPELFVDPEEEEPAG